MKYEKAYFSLPFYTVANFFKFKSPKFGNLKLKKK